MPLGDSMQQYTYEYLLQLALSQVSDTVDKREGSVIYDALAPACYVLAEYFAENYRLAQEINVETASGEWLDAKVAEAGISRNPATAAVKYAYLKKLDGSVADVPNGARFVTLSDNPLTYVIIGSTIIDSQKVYLAQCETVGIASQEYYGNIIPLDYVSELASATLGDYQSPGSDVETDDNLRQRYLSKVNYRAFAGNIAHYKELALGINGVGGVQVYPTWNGGGTVKLSIVDSDFMPIRNTNGSEGAFVRTVQNVIDPDAIMGQASSGLGLGNAPIDHRVTVTTPTALEVVITADITTTGAVIEVVMPKIISAVENYFRTLRQNWDEGNDLNEYSLSIFQAQIIRAVLSVEEIANVTNVRLNGNAEDIILTQSSAIQQIPILKSINGIEA